MDVASFLYFELDGQISKSGRRQNFLDQFRIVPREHFHLDLFVHADDIRVADNLVRPHQRKIPVHPVPFHLCG